MRLVTPSRICLRHAMPPQPPPQHRQLQGEPLAAVSARYRLDVLLRRVPRRALRPHALLRSAGHSQEYLAKPITHADVDEARDVFAAHGEPFNETGWRYIIERGHLPIRVRAVPEGTVVPTHQALVTIESTDPDAYWVPSYLETMLLRGRMLLVFHTDDQEATA